MFLKHLDLIYKFMILIVNPGNFKYDFQGILLLTKLIFLNVLNSIYTFDMLDFSM